MLGEHDHLPTPRATIKALQYASTEEKPITIRRGGSGRGCGVGTLASPASLFLSLPSCGNMTTLHPAGDHKGPHHLSSSALAPTDRPALCLSSRLRLMRIGRHSWRPIR